MEPVPSIEHLPELVARRRQAITVRDQHDEIVKAINRDILNALAAAGTTERLQLVTGAILTIVRPTPRRVVKAEKLLKLGVAVDIIEKATDSSPVSPYLRVDEPESELPASDVTDEPRQEVPARPH